MIEKNKKDLPFRKALFCGLGSIGQRHLRNLRSLTGDDVEFIAYRARGSDFVLNDQGKIIPGASLSERYGVKMFADLSEALAEKPDVAFITNPNVFHLPIAQAAADAGCHLFIEKPLAQTLEGIDKLIDTVEGNKLITFVAYQFRFHPGLMKIKEIIGSGRLGRLVAAHIVNGEYIPDWHPYEDYRDTHPARRDLGGGCLHIQTHELDYGLWLFGMPRKVFAVGGHLSRLEVDVEDSVSILLECEFEGRPLPLQIHLDYLQRPAQRVCEIIGDTGKLRYDYYTNEVIVNDTHTRTEDVFNFQQFERNRMFIDELNHFMDCIMGRTKPLVDLNEGRRSVQIALAAHASLDSGQAVEVTDV